MHDIQSRQDSLGVRFGTFFLLTAEGSSAVFFSTSQDQQLGMQI